MPLKSMCLIEATIVVVFVEGVKNDHTTLSYVNKLILARVFGLRYPIHHFLVQLFLP